MISLPFEMFKCVNCGESLKDALIVEDSENQIKCKKCGEVNTICFYSVGNYDTYYKSKI